MSTKVIARKHLPAEIPVIPTLVWYLFLDRLHAPGWAWGAIGVLLLISWIVNIVRMATQEERSPF